MGLPWNRLSDCLTAPELQEIGLAYLYLVRRRSLKFILNMSFSVFFGVENQRLVAPSAILINSTQLPERRYSCYSLQANLIFSTILRMPGVKDGYILYTRIKEVQLQRDLLENSGCQALYLEQHTSLRSIETTLEEFVKRPSHVDSFSPGIYSL